MKTLEQRIRVLENKIGIKESRVMEITLEVSLRFARRLKDTLQDLNLEPKLGIEIEPTSTNTWDIKFFDYEGSKQDLIDELTSIFEDEGIKEFYFD